MATCRLERKAIDVKPAIRERETWFRTAVEVAQGEAREARQRADHAQEQVQQVTIRAIVAEAERDALEGELLAWTAEPRAA